MTCNFVYKIGSTSEIDDENHLGHENLVASDDLIDCRPFRVSLKDQDHL